MSPRRLWPMTVALLMSFTFMSVNSMPSEIQPSCEQVKSFLNHHATSQHHQGAASSSACESRDSCCTAAMEISLEQSARRDFHNALRVASQHLRLTLTEAAQAIQGQMLEHVKASMIKTQTMFGELYKRIARLASDPITALFADLDRFFTGQDGEVDVADSVNRFFTELFPRLYGQTTRGVQGPSLATGRLTFRDLSHEYVECLRGAQKNLQPFGLIQERLANSLSRSLDTSRILIKALKLGSKVLNATDHTHLNSECSAALFRATHCAQCRGYAVAKPCRGLCSNVARGCLAALADVDQPWNDMVEGMERLTGALINGDLDAHDVLASIDSRLSEAVINALENGPMLEKKVKEMCGESGNTTGDGSEGRFPAQEASDSVSNSGSLEEIKDLSVISDQSVSGDFKSKLEALLPTLSSARGFYANLPDTVCVTKASPFASLPEDANCWNGQRLGEYTKPISGIGIGGQKYNAEVKVTRDDVDLSLAELSGELRRTRQVLVNKLVLAPAPESMLMGDSGSGSGDGDGGTWPKSGWDGPDSESDRDDNGGRGGFPDLDDEGSGSGDGPSKPAVDSDNTGSKTFGASDDIELGGESESTTPSVTVKDKPSGSASAFASSSVIVGLLTAVSVMRCRYLD